MELTESERQRSIEAFKALGVHSQLAEAAASLKWKSPTPIQLQAVPHLLQGKHSCETTCAVVIIEFAIIMIIARAMKWRMSAMPVTCELPFCTQGKMS